MARRKRKNMLFNMVLIILLIILGFIAFKAYDSYRTSKEDNFIKEEKEKATEVKKVKEENSEEEKKETTNTTQKSSSDEKEEIKNEVERKGGVVNIELKGDDEITIKKGDSFNDPGFTATYEDGTDASSEVKVEGTVDTSKEGKYTISYSVGNNIVMRRVIVE